MKKYNKPEIIYSDVLINEVILESGPWTNKEETINFADLDGIWKDWN